MVKQSIPVSQVSVTAQYGDGDTEDILGSAGFKDVTKGVRSVLADFCSCG